MVNLIFANKHAKATETRRSRDTRTNKERHKYKFLPRTFTFSIV